MAYHRPKLSVIFVLFNLFAWSFSSANPLIVSNYDTKVKSQLNALDVQLSQEVEAFQRAVSGLADAEESFKATAIELEKALLAAKNSGDNADFRDVRIINVRFKRHQQKVERYQTRVEQRQSNILSLRNKISSEEERLAELGRKVRPKPKRASLKTSPQAQKPFPKTTLVESSVAIDTPVKSTQWKRIKAKMQQQPADWPHLSNARDIDVEYASERLKTLLNKQLSGTAGEAPLNNVEINASRSFGEATLEYIGDNLFTTVQPVASGLQLFKIFDLEQWHTIPDSDNNAPYRIIFDINSISHPRLILFREDLIAKSSRK